MPNLDITTVYLTPEQCALFILFQEHYDNISFMLANKAFDMKHGNVVLSFDDLGLVKAIKKEIFIQR